MVQSLDLGTQMLNVQSRSGVHSASSLGLPGFFNVGVVTGVHSIPLTFTSVQVHRMDRESFSFTFYSLLGGLWSITTSCHSLGCKIWMLRLSFTKLNFSSWDY